MDKEKINYELEWIKSDSNILMMVICMVLAMVGSGLENWSFFLLPVIMEVVSVLVMPMSVKFRTEVEEKIAREKREASRKRWLEELGNTSSAQSDLKRFYNAYIKMMEQIESMRKLASDERSTIKTSDVDRLDDTAVNYISLMVAWRSAFMQDDSVKIMKAQKQLESIDEQLKKNMPEFERQNWLKAQQEYRGMLIRAKKKAGRLMVLEASLNTVPDKVEEVYQMMMAAPYASDISFKLEESLNKLKLQEEVENLVNKELEDPSVKDYTQKDENWNAWMQENYGVQPKGENVLTNQQPDANKVKRNNKQKQAEG